VNSSPPAEPHARPPFVARVLLGAIGAYQRYLSPWLGTHCRFHPTCSAYAAEAIRRYGPARGGWLALRRILRCHPLSPGGFDPVPERPGRDRAAPGGGA